MEILTLHQRFFMKFSTFIFPLFILITLPILLLTGCTNPYDLNTSEGYSYTPPYYGTYPDSPYYDNDYYMNYKREHHGKSDHRHDSQYGPNQTYKPSEKQP